eukprot:COSAG02_NODE_2333_length_9117_cov_5.841428_6_plen_41_part_00
MDLGSGLWGMHGVGLSALRQGNATILSWQVVAAELKSDWF